jgi:metallo-beta-lactamase class B
MENKARSVLLLLAGLMAGAVFAAPPPATHPDWTAAQAPFKIYGNTYYVGSKGITSLLITSEFGHVLIDGGPPENAKLIAKNIESLGFKLTDVKAILNSHAHWDHMGGIAELQQLTGAPVYLRRPSEQALRTGKLAPDDPQFGMKAPAIPPAKTIWIVSDEQLLGIGSNRLQAFATAGHTPGGTTWAWDACDKDKCLKVVYADSLTPVSAEKFKFSASKSYPEVLGDFEQSFTRLETMPCDVLITPHPEVSDFFERIAKRDADKPESLKEEGGCKRYAQAARAKLAERLASEKKGT